MTANELRVKFIEFFKSNGHAQIKSVTVALEKFSFPGYILPDKICN